MHQLGERSPWLSLFQNLCQCLKHVRNPHVHLSSPSFQFGVECNHFLPFHTVRGVLKARILKWFAIPFSIGPYFVRILHPDLSVLVGPMWHGSFIEFDKAVIHVISLVSFL